MKINKKNWPIGIVDSIEASSVIFTANVADIQDQVSKGNVLSINGINDFVYSKININTYLLMRIIKVKNGLEDLSKTDNSFIAVNKVTFFAEPLGMLENGKFISGFQQFPMVGTEIFGVTDDVLLTFFSSIGDHLITLGPVNNYSNVNPYLNLGKILTSHLAIIGNTGSGKSTTLRVLLDRIAGVQDQLSDLFKMFVFDVHGDYNELNFAKHLKVREKHIDLEKLNIEDWCAALLPSEKTQKPILRRAVDVAKILDEHKSILYAMLAKSALEYATQESFSSLKRVVTKWFKKFDKSFNVELLNKWMLKFGNESDEKLEIERILNNELSKCGFKTVNDLIQADKQENFTLSDLEEAFDIVFGEEEVRGNIRARAHSETMMARFRNLQNQYGQEGGILNQNNGEELTLRENEALKGNKFFILDLTGLDDIALRLVSNYLVRSVFEFNRNFDRSNRKRMPFNYLYLDEAHRYVQNTDATEPTIFDTIAREGRKFNVYLGVISQIPSELSKTVMSQVGAYFIHRIQNSVDLDYVRRNVPAASNSMVSRLPVLPAGTALLSGTAFDVSFELNIDADRYGEASSSLSPIKNE